MRITRRASVILLSVALITLTARAQVSENMTPLQLAVHDAPVPFMGSDGSIHLVYELWMTNFSSADIAPEKVEILSDGVTLQTLDAAAIAKRLQPIGMRDSVSTIAKSTQAILFLNVTLAPNTKTPHQLSHRVLLRASAAPPDHQELTETGGATNVDYRPVVSIAPPLQGIGYVSADSCCDATRHTRAALPINGNVWVAQRYAVDWEQVDASNRIYTGPSKKLESYTIFGKPALAVADSTVVSVIDGLPEQTPGEYPVNIPLDQADGNSVCLDLGQQNYATYAHLQPGSIKVHKGDKVKLGQVLGLVGNTGNSVAPHLHFQVTDRPSPLASNGLPYTIRDFQITGKTSGTEAFDEAESKGVQILFTPLAPALSVKEAMPLDQLIISFVEH
jgi:hypothetical protein